MKKIVITVIITVAVLVGASFFILMPEGNVRMDYYAKMTNTELEEEVKKMYQKEYPDVTVLTVMLDPA